MKLNIKKVYLPDYLADKKVLGIADIKRIGIKDKSSYKTLETIATVMDDYYLDPLIGLVPGLGDFLSSAASLPYIYVCMFDIKSVPLTLYVLANALKDSLIGMIPFWIGNVLDIFIKSNKKNYQTIIGYVEGDQKIRNEVNRTAAGSAFLIVVLLVVGFFMVKWVISLGSWAKDFISGLAS